MIVLRGFPQAIVTRGFAWSAAPRPPVDRTWWWMTARRVPLEIRAQVVFVGYPR